MSILTFKFKLKKAPMKSLAVQSGKVNAVWNFCNETSIKAIKRDGKFLSAYDLHKLTSGSAVLINLHSHTIQLICTEYAIKRKQFKKRKMRWRKSKGPRRSLGWIPFKANGVKVEGDKITFLKKTYRFFKSRELPGPVKTGCFVQDSCGDWHVCFQCEVGDLPTAPVKEVGIDLGLKDLAATSDGQIFNNPKTFRHNEQRLGMAQRARKKKQASRIHRKIARTRLDHIHKVSTELSATYQTIFVGDLNLAKGKSTNDTAYRGLINLLGYKARRRQGSVILVNERSTTIMCSNCLDETGPSGLDGLSIREWACASCGQTHGRDVNSAINILRTGRGTPETFSEPLAN